MSGRSGVSKSDVFYACEQLVKSGGIVTIANVRKELGTGSYSTLAPLVAEWKNSSEQSALEAKELPGVPGELSELGQKFVADLWMESSLIVQRKIEDLEKKHAEELAKLTSSLDAKTTELNQAIEDIKSMEQQCEELQQSQQELQTKTHQKDGEISLLKDQLKKKEEESTALLERAVRAEKDAEIKRK